VGSAVALDEGLLMKKARANIESSLTTEQARRECKRIGHYIGWRSAQAARGRTQRCLICRFQKAHVFY
jgi:hypothetical protein